MAKQGNSVAKQNGALLSGETSAGAIWRWKTPESVHSILWKERRHEMVR